MGIIRLNGLSFKAYHGYYEEERERGNHFEVDIVIHTDFEQATQSDDLNDTIDYTSIYTLVKKHMMISSRLLEHVVGNIIEDLIKSFPAIQEVTVTLAKLNPPVGGPCKSSVVEMSRRRGAD